MQRLYAPICALGTVRNHSRHARRPLRPLPQWISAFISKIGSSIAKTMPMTNRPMPTISSGPSSPISAASSRLELALLVGGGTLEHGLQLAAGFAAGDQVHRHRRKQAAGGQRAADRGALAHARGRLGDRIAHRQVGDHLAGDAQRIEHRHGAGRQDAQRAREACGVEAAQDAPDDRQVQQQLDESGAALACDLQRARADDAWPRRSPPAARGRSCAGSR